jgi:autotransporter-associated beta strand protein
VIGGAISLRKSGLGTQVLGDANTYTGTTTIDAGALAVNGSL